MRLIRYVLATLVGGLLLVAAYLSYLISQGHFALEQAARYNIVWAVNQAVVELTRLEQVAARAAAFDDERATREVDLRYEILLGRADVLRSGQSAEFVRSNPEYITIVDELWNALDEAAPFVERIGEPGAAIELSRILSPLQTRLAHLASSARQFGDNLNALDQARLRRLHMVYTATAGGLIVCGFSLIIALLWNNRLLGRAHDELRILAEELTSVSGTLRLQNHRFEAALQNMSQGLCMADASGRLVIANNRFREMFGISEYALASGLSQGQPLLRSASVDTGPALHDIYAQQAFAIQNDESRDFVYEWSDGRAISVNHVALGNGGWLATYEDISDRRQAELQIIRMAHHDSLTDLANRGLFKRTLENALAESATKAIPLAILFLDLDDFKIVNDTLGHHVGDQVLKAVAARLRSCVRSGDLVARLGGDEFGILLHSADHASTPADIASRILKYVGEPYLIDGQEILIGISIGIAEAKDEYPEPEQFLKHADLALYDVKASGKRGFRIFEASLEQRLQDRVQMEADLRKSIANGELEVHYQPAAEVASLRLSGFEALVRWRHPARGMVPPILFVPIAEETGLIGAIGEWVLRQACLTAASWPPNVKIAVNISAHQFRDERFVEKVSDVLSESGLCPSRLELEITETVVLEHNEANLAILHALREIGVRIAMDDFGTGYSSLSYLLGFPFDKIKIDRSFVARLADSGDSKAVVQLVCDLGDKLNITTCAEGVETVSQLTFLRSVGCREIQGFYVSRPMPSSDVTSFINAYCSPADQSDKSTRTARALRECEANGVLL